MCAASSEACRSPPNSLREGLLPSEPGPAGHFFGGCLGSVCKAAREMELYEVRTGELLQRQIINLR